MLLYLMQKAIYQVNTYEMDKRSDNDNKNINVLTYYSYFYKSDIITSNEWGNSES